MDLEKKFSEALKELGYKLEGIYEEEYDPALGNGGLGQLQYILIFIKKLNLKVNNYLFIFINKYIFYILKDVLLLASLTPWPL